ncbi:MAG: hypothetical protein GY811_09830 [Myxococcales bacterium]|nr:hypothetical protein [Myxococcales bacterium]
MCFSVVFISSEVFPFFVVKHADDGRRVEFNLDEETITLQFDEAGRIIRHGDHTYVVENGRTVGIRYGGDSENGSLFHYNDRGQVVAIDYPMSVRHEYTYDKRGLVLSESTVVAGKMQVEVRHEHDDSGRLLVSRHKIGTLVTRLAYQYRCPE